MQHADISRIDNAWLQIGAYQTMRIKMAEVAAIAGHAMIFARIGATGLYVACQNYRLWLTEVCMTPITRHTPSSPCTDCAMTSRLWPMTGRWWNRPMRRQLMAAAMSLNCRMPIPIDMHARSPMQISGPQNLLVNHQIDWAVRVNAFQH